MIDAYKTLHFLADNYNLFQKNGCLPKTSASQRLWDELSHVFFGKNPHRSVQREQRFRFCNAVGRGSP